MKTLILIFTVFLAATAARAEPYIEARGLVANLSEPADSTGAALAVGYDFGVPRIEVEASNHMHLGNGTAGIIGMGYAEFDLGPVTPYIGVGAGYADRTALQASAGVAYPVTERVSAIIGYTHRWYGDIEDFGDSEDGYGVIGLRARF